MTESAVTRGRQKLPRRHDGNRAARFSAVAHQLEQANVRDYTAAYGRPPRADTLENLIGFALQLAGAVRYDGLEFQRSWLQLQRGIARHNARWVPHSTVNEARRARSSMRRMLGYFIAMGWVASWEPVYSANGEGEGILVRVAPNAPVAQLDSAAGARTRGDHPPPRPRRRPAAPEPGSGRALSAPQVVPPSGETERLGSSTDSGLRGGGAVPARTRYQGRRDGASMRGVRRPGALGPLEAATGTPGTGVGVAGGGAATEALRRRALEATVGAGDPVASVVVELEAAAVDGADPMDVAIVGWERLRRLTDRSPNVRLFAGNLVDGRWKPGRYQQGRRDLEVANRWGAFGTGRDRPGEAGQSGTLLLLSLLETAALEGWQPIEWHSRHPDRNSAINRRAAGEVCSLAHYLCHVGQAGRQWRRHARGHSGVPR